MITKSLPGYHLAMSTIYYEVQATFADDDTARRWLAWLREEHLAEVIACGARSGRIVRLDEPPRTYIVQYDFASRDAFNRYVAEHAPRLRADGLQRFPSPPTTYARRVGEILA